MAIKQHVNKTYSFDINMDGFYPVAESPSVEFSYDSINGGLSQGCIRVDLAGESAVGSMNTGIGRTWESFGVPPGAKVVSVRLLGVNIRGLIEQ